MSEATISMPAGRRFGSRVRDIALIEAGALVALFVTYSSFLTYDYAYHLDYYMLTKPYLHEPNAQMYQGFWEYFFIFAEGPYLIRIGRLLNAILVSLQSHLILDVETFRYVRAFYLLLLAGIFLWLSRIFAGHFRLSPVGARVLALLLALSPPLQQSVFMSTFSAPLFASLITAVASYMGFVKLATRVDLDSTNWPVRKSLGPLLLLIMSLSCYSPMSMFFAALALLELTVGVRAGPNARLSAFKFTVRVVLFVLLAVGLYFVLDRAIYSLLFAHNPAIIRINPTRFYSLSLGFLTSLDGFGSRLENFWITYHNAAGLWDQSTSVLTLTIVTVLVVMAVIQPTGRMAFVSLANIRSRAHPFWRTAFAHVAMADFCKLVLFVFSVLPFLVPDAKATWDNGYRDSFRTLPAIEAAILFLLYDFFRQLPFTITAISSFSDPQELRRRLAGYKSMARVGVALIVLIASVLSFRTMDVGSRWANVQMQFYQALGSELYATKIDEMVFPCGNGDTWLWESPTIRGEYAYTSIQWADYIKYRLPVTAASKDVRMQCGWLDVQFEFGPYVRRDGNRLLVNYRRFVNDYARYTTQQVYLPFSHQGRLFPKIMEVASPLPTK